MFLAYLLFNRNCCNFDSDIFHVFIRMIYSRENIVASVQILCLERALFRPALDPFSLLLISNVSVGKEDELGRNGKCWWPSGRSVAKLGYTVSLNCISFIVSGLRSRLQMLMRTAPKRN